MIDEEQPTQPDASISPAKSKKEKLVFKMTNVPSIMPTKDRQNPYLNEVYEPSGAHLSCQKQFKGHLMGVTSLSYNPKKDILVLVRSERDPVNYTKKDGSPGRARFSIKRMKQYFVD